jgi:hypothetical protein
MKYALEMGLGAMMYVHTKFHKDWFRHSKLNRWEGTQTACRSHKPTFIFFQNMANGLKTPLVFNFKGLLFKKID